MLTMKITGKLWIHQVKTHNRVILYIKRIPPAGAFRVLINFLSMTLRRLEDKYFVGHFIKQKRKIWPLTGESYEGQIAYRFHQS